MTPPPVQGESLPLEQHPPAAAIRSGTNFLYRTPPTTTIRGNLLYRTYTDSATLAVNKGVRLYQGHPKGFDTAFTVMDKVGNGSVWMNLWSLRQDSPG